MKEGVRIVPHLKAQCLHLWNTEGAQNKYWISGAGGDEAYLPEERTFCLEEGLTGSATRGNQGETATAIEGPQHSGAGFHTHTM